jgi:hypothetical protein
MWDSSGMKFSLMKEEVSWSEYDSASSRAHAPQAGAALKSMRRGFFVSFAFARAASASVFHSTSICFSSDPGLIRLINWGPRR